MNSKTRTLGFSLIEIIIVLAITAAITMALLALVTSFWQTRSQSYFSNRLLTTSELIFDQITRDMHDSKSVELEYQAMTLVLFSDEVIKYEYQVTNGSVTRNGQRLHPPEVQITEFKLTPRSPQEPLPLVEIKLNLESQDSRVAKAKLSRQTTISLRSNRGKVEQP